MCNIGVEQIEKDIGLYKKVSVEEQKKKLKEMLDDKRVSD